jgi:hypothetical protein
VIKKIISRGIVIGLSFGLASVGWGPELTASHLATARSDVQRNSRYVANDLQRKTATGYVAQPKLICDPGVTCGYWEYFIPGEYCISVYPNNEDGRCTEVDMSFEGRYHNGNFVEGCLINAGLAQGWTWVGGPEIDLAGDIFACVTGGFEAWIS